MTHTDDRPIRTPVGAFWPNPGSGVVIGGDEDVACANMARFAEDVEASGVSGVRYLRESREDERGRYGFLLYREAHVPPRLCCVVEMPGLPIEQVRFIGSPQRALDFPRLYVDSSSWLWKYAVERAAELLTGMA